MIIDKGWSGVSLRWGTAFFKKVNYQMKEGHLNAVDGCDTWVYDPKKEPWTEYKNYDLGGKGDVKSISNWKDQYTWD